MAFVGFDGATFTNAPNTGVIFVNLAPFEERVAAGLTKDRILNDLRQQLSKLKEAFVFVLEPPSVPGIGTGGGLKGYVQDKAGRGLPALEAAAWAMAGTTGQKPGVRSSFTLFNVRHARSVCRHRPYESRAAWRGDQPRVFETLSVYMGSASRQRLQHPRANLPGDGTSRQSVPPVAARCLKLEDAEQCRRHGTDRLGRDLQETRPAHTACRATTSTPPRKSRCSSSAVTQTGDSHQDDGERREPPS